MIDRVFGSFVGGRAAWGLLVVRVVFGLGIAQHGWGKIQHPFTWMGQDAAVPGFLQALAALSEFGGGVALILGLLTPLALLGLAITMIVAITTVHLKAGHPFVARGGGPSYELAALYLAVSLLALIAGPGKLSLDAKLFGRSRLRLAEAA
jgi:putative oxidoreductase